MGNCSCQQCLTGQHQVHHTLKYTNGKKRGREEGMEEGREVEEERKSWKNEKESLLLNMDNTCIEPILQETYLNNP